MKLIITGGCGFIGSAVCRYLLGKAGHTVVNIDKLTYAANPASLAPIASHPGYKFVNLDVCDLAAMSAVLETEQPDGIVHLAAESHVDRSIGGPAAFIETNVFGTYAVLEAARGYWHSLPARRKSAFRVLYVSTDEVFGSLGARGAFTETSRYDPSSPYSASKAAADHLAQAWFRTYGLPVITTNCSNNFGPYHHPEKLIPLMITNALLGWPLPVYGRGANVRDWLHVDDHVTALACVLDGGVPGQSYVIGGGNERTNLAMVTAICTILDDLAPRHDGKSHDTAIRFVTDRPGHDFRYAVDHTKITRELRWAPRETLESGLCATVAWYIANEHWWRPLRTQPVRGNIAAPAPKLTTPVAARAVAC